MLFEIIPIIIFCTVTVFVINFSFCYHNGGVRNHLLNIFTNLIFIIYLFNAPIAYYFRNFYWAFNVDIKDYYGVGFLQLLLYLFFYNLAYLLFFRKRRNRSKFTDRIYREVVGCKIERKLLIMFGISYTAIFINTLSEGINLVDVFLGKYGDPTMGLKGGSYYIQNLADSLISFLIIAYYFRLKKRNLTIMMLLSIPLFLILGFRYRILLTFFGLFLIYIYDRGLTFKSILKYISILLLALYAMLLLTENRNAIYMQKFDQLTFNMSEFDYDIIFDQARGSVMDFAVYQYMDNSSNVSIDYGETMFGYIIVKLMPSVFFEGGVKPYPPPTFLIIDEAIGATRDNGEAVTSLGGTFLSFYYPGIYVSGFLLGFIIAKLQNRFDNNDFSMLGAIIANLVLFQWISRGYLPQVIDHLAYMLFPLLMIRYFSNYKIRVDANPTVK